MSSSCLWWDEYRVFQKSLPSSSSLNWSTNFYSKFSIKLEFPWVELYSVLHCVPLIKHWICWTQIKRKEFCVPLAPFVRSSYKSVRIIQGVSVCIGAMVICRLGNIFWGILLKGTRSLGLKPQTYSEMLYISNWSNYERIDFINVFSIFRILCYADLVIWFRYVSFTMSLERL